MTAPDHRCVGQNPGEAPTGAGLAHLSWHDFRRTYIGDLINKYDLVTAQKIIGHSSTSITAKYDCTWQDKAREAARMRVISYKTGGGNENVG
jgi:integrase